MIRRLRSFLASRLALVYVIEATFVGLFFVQALRFLIGTVYARIASASLYPALNPALIDPTLPGLVDPATVNNELSFLTYMVFLPVLAVIAGHFRWLLIPAVLTTVAGRYLMAAGDISPSTAAAVTVGGGLLYIALLVRHRARTLPFMFVLAFGIDQLFRAAGDTLDPSWSPRYETAQVILSIITLLIAFYAFVQQARQRTQDESDISPDIGVLSIWSGIGLGALLFLQASLLAMPNVIAARADTAYILIVPLLVVATLLPIIPFVRGQARQFIGLFDASVRGWAWMLVIMLFVVLGTRIQGVIGGVALVLAQFLTSMTWWWLVRPKTAKERNLSGLWITIGMAFFAILVVFDIFTYEYAFVRDFPPGLSLFDGAIALDFLNAIIPPVLRGFRGLGLAVILLAVFMALLPMAQTRRRIPWAGGDLLSSLLLLLVVGSAGAGAAYLSRLPVIQGVREPMTIRIGTYNIHAGYNEFFDYNLEAIAQTIQQSGANIVLLQEVESGRMTSFGVDQSLWLARRLGMDRRMFPTNEGLQGLAVLSNIEIVFDEGILLDSTASQTGLQRVQVLPDTGVITVYNTWLDPLLDTGDATTPQDLEASQQNQLSQIFSIISAHHPDGQLGRTVFGGTFNNIPDSDLIQRMRDNGFVDHFGDGTLEQTATFWRTGERARLDYLWTVRMTVIGRNVIDTHASDHRMATIGVQLRQES